MDFSHLGEGLLKFGKKERRVPADPMAFQSLQVLRAYWEALRVGGALPRREDIDPRGMEGALSETFLLEHVAPGVARFRLAGMHLTDLMGMDVRGMPLTTLIEPAERVKISDALKKVSDDFSVVEIDLEADRGLGRPALTGRMLLLPLAAPERGGALTLGCLATDGVLGRAPRRFFVAGRRATPALARAVAKPVPLRVLESGFGEAAAPFAGHAKRPPVTGRPHLRVVRNDE